MATLTSSKVASSVQSRGGIDITAVYATYSLSAALANGDVIQMVKIPAGATVLEVLLASDDLDTNGTPTITLAVGDGSDADGYITGSTVGRAGGLQYMNASALFLKKYTEEDTIDVSVTAGPATGATSGDVKLVVQYTMQQ